MVSLIVTIVLGAWVLLFAAMALFPLLLDSGNRPAKRRDALEDRVLRLEHRAVIERRQVGIEPGLAPLDAIGDHPSHRSAA